MDHVALIDLRHMGRPRALGVYLIPGLEPVLVDCGPTSCLDALSAGLEANGVAVEDLAHLLLTHVHLDHAGGAGALVARNPRLCVHVSPFGAPHLIDPARLERSARRVFGARFDALWGPLAPVPAANVFVVGERAAGLECVPTPGHAAHHTSFFTSDGTCFSGDVTGVRIAPTDYVAAGTPPPDVDLEAYAVSLAAIERRAPRRLCLAHFGIFDDVSDHLVRQRAVLARWSGWVRDGATEPEFIARATAEQEGLEPEAVSALEAAADFRPSYAGLVRYWKSRRRADAPGATTTREVSTPDGARLVWDEEGNGPRVLLVHGGTGTGAFDWEFVRPRLRERHRLLIADLRGHGRSSDPEGRLGIGQIGEDVETLLEAAGGCDVIVAFSIAASAMIALLCRRPELTRAFVSIAGSIMGDPGRVEEFADGPWPSDLVALRHEHATDDDYWRSLRAAMARSWGAHRVTDAELAGLTVPTLVVAGDRDRVEPLATALALRERLPVAELLVIPGGRHFVPRERPELLAGEITEFLGRRLT